MNLRRLYPNPTCASSAHRSARRPARLEAKKSVLRSYLRSVLLYNAGLLLSLTLCSDSSSVFLLSPSSTLSSSTCLHGRLLLTLRLVGARVLVRLTAADLLTRSLRLIPTEQIGKHMTGTGLGPIMTEKELHYTTTVVAVEAEVLVTTVRP